MYHLESIRNFVYISNAVTSEKIDTKKRGCKKKKSLVRTDHRHDGEHGVVCLFLLSSMFLRCSNEYKETGQKKISPSDIWFMLIIYFFFSSSLFLQFLRAGIRRIRQTKFFNCLSGWIYFSKENNLDSNIKMQLYLAIKFSKIINKK